MEEEWVPFPGLTDYVTDCTVLYCTVLYCTVLYCTVLYCTILEHLLFCTGIADYTVISSTGANTWDSTNLKPSQTICSPPFSSVMFFKTINYSLMPLIWTYFQIQSHIFGSATERGFDQCGGGAGIRKGKKYIVYLYKGGLDKGPRGSLS